MSDMLDKLIGEVARHAAAQMLCRARVVEELHRRKGTSTAVHLKIVLAVIDGPAIVPLEDEQRRRVVL